MPGSLKRGLTIETTSTEDVTLPILFSFSREGRTTTTILKEKKLMCISRSNVALYNRLKPNVPYDPQSSQRSARRDYERDLPMVKSDFFPEFE